MDENRRSNDAAIARLEEQVIELRSEVSGMKDSIKGLLDAWKTANGVASFLKWMSGLGLGAAFFWELIRNHWK